MAPIFSRSPNMKGASWRWRQCASPHGEEATDTEFLWIYQCIPPAPKKWSDILDIPDRGIKITWKYKKSPSSWSTGNLTWQLNFPIRVCPKIGGTPKSSMLIGSSTINHLPWGICISGTPHFSTPDPLKKEKPSMKWSWLNSWLGGGFPK